MVFFRKSIKRFLDCYLDCFDNNTCLKFFLVITNWGFGLFVCGLCGFVFTDSFSFGFYFSEKNVLYSQWLEI